MLVETKKTIMSEGEITYYLREAWKCIYGEYPSLDSLAILFAQIALECGRGTMCRNYNLGNVKRRDGYDYCMYYCSEYINGKEIKFNPPHPQTHFVALSTPLDGAIFHIGFLSNRSNYKKAWKEVIKGDVVKYVYEIKQGGYFTAPLDKYTAVVVSIFNEFKRRSEKLLAWTPPKPEPDPIVEVKPILKEPVPIYEEKQIITVNEKPVTIITATRKEENIILRLLIQIVTFIVTFFKNIGR